MVKIDFAGIEQLLEAAYAEGRGFLYEGEVYKVLQLSGIRTPKAEFVPKTEDVDPHLLRQYPGSWIVLKIVSDTISHKTEVGGVRVVEKDYQVVCQAIKQMLSTVPRNYQQWLERYPELTPPAYQDLKGKDLGQQIERDLRGVMICEYIDYAKGFFSSELLAGFRWSREFGPIILFGSGGVDTEFFAERLMPGQGVAIGSALLAGSQELEEVVTLPAVYQKLSGRTRGQSKLVDKEKLLLLMETFHSLANHFSSPSEEHSLFITEAEVNPLVVVSGELIALDGLLRFQRASPRVPERPINKIVHLLSPGSIGIIGISRRHNLGHIILNNLLRAGYDKERIYIVKEGVESIEDCRCFPSIAELPEKVGLFIVAIKAEQTPDIVEELISSDKAEALILISSGLGERVGSQPLEQRIKRAIQISRQAGRDTPVLNGGNSMGIRSQPGRVDTFFVPSAKLPPTQGIKSNVVYLGQSGAFMVTLLSRLTTIKPLYAISTGNQIDLTLGDYLRFFSERDDGFSVLAAYVEGFQELDGLQFARGVRELARQGKDVIVYKAGRTKEGIDATSGHTASLAGDYRLAFCILSQAGALIAESMEDFRDYIRLSSLFAGKRIEGRRVGCLSNAGFETVSMADNVGDSRYLLVLPPFSSKTKKRLSEILKKLKILEIINIRNPLDLTPMADDQTFYQCAKAVLEDEAIDGALISLVPLAPSLQTLQKGLSADEDIHSPESIGQRLIKLSKSCKKPFVVSVDAGSLYDPLVKMLEEGGIPTFRSADRAIGVLGRYINYKLRTAGL